MSTNSAINFKVFLRDGNSCDARRFALDAGVVTSFFFMKEKLQSLLPALKDAEYKITWKDSDGDEITITSDEDLITAYTEMNSSVKVLYITILRRGGDFEIEIEEPAMEQRHVGRVFCDGCSKHITGIRFKCIQCPDYDLCSECEHQGIHTEHLMMRMPHNFSPFPRCSRRNIHSLLRSFRKNCHFNRDHHHGPRHCPKGGNEEGAARAEGCKQKEAEAKQGGCPFAEGVDFTQLAQHFGPLLEAFARPAQSNAAEGETSVDPLSELIRNVAHGVFGRPAENNNNNNNTQPEQTNQNNNNNNNTNSQAPMEVIDVESSSSTSSTPQNPPQPANADGAAPDKRREPGWTFVPAEAPDTPTSSTAQAPLTGGNPSSAPIFLQQDRSPYAQALLQLKEMGFSNENNRLTHLLERYNGNVSKVVKALLEMSF